MSSDMASIAGRETPTDPYGPLRTAPAPGSNPVANGEYRSDNTGGNACYRISKAGLNQLTKTMAVDLARSAGSKVLALAVHPGFVPTKMTGYHGEDDMDTCMSSLVEVIVKFGTPDGQELRNGGYYRWNGQRMEY